MYARICAENKSLSKVVSVYINDTIYFRDLIEKSVFKDCAAGSIIVTVLDSRERVMHDIYLPVSPRRRYILEILPQGYKLIPLGFF